MLMRKSKGMLERAVIMSVTFLIAQVPQNAGQMVFDKGEKGMKGENDAVVATLIWCLLGIFSCDS